jgi:nucleotide-binding universal stress UspA family protein
MEYIRKNIILVPTDFSEVADYAIEHAIGTAKSLNYEICLVHIINKDTKSQLKKDKQDMEVIHQRLEKKANEIKANNNLKVTYVAKEGSLFTTIADVTRETGANLVVMGTHGKIGSQKVFGSYAFKVIVASPAPLMLVQKRAFEGGYKHIILPLDDSLESKQKVKWAIYVAKKFQSTVHIFAMKETDEVLKRKVRHNLKQIKTILTQNNILCTEKIADKVGGFPKQIVKHAVEIKADMIMIMTNPDQLVPSFILTPNDEKIIFNEAKIPVLCINPVDMNFQVGGF